MFKMLFLKPESMEKYLVEYIFDDKVVHVVLFFIFTAKKVPIVVGYRFVVNIYATTKLNQPHYWMRNDDGLSCFVITSA